MNEFRQSSWRHLSKKMAHEIGANAWHYEQVYSTVDYPDYSVRPMSQLIQIYCNQVGQQEFIDKYYYQDVLYASRHQKIKRTIRRCDNEVKIYVNDLIVAEGKLKEKND